MNKPGDGDNRSDKDASPLERQPTAAGASTSPLPSRIRLFAVDDQPMVLRGLHMLLDLEPDLQVCGAADSVSSAKRGIADLHPNLVIVDLSLRDGDGFELMEWLGRHHPHIKPLVFSGHGDLASTERASRCGAQGYVMKSDGAGELIRAIRLVMRNQHYVSSTVAHKARLSSRSRKNV